MLVNKAQLLSRAIRSQLAPDGRTRKINLKAFFGSPGEGNPLSNFIKWVSGGLVGVAKFIGGVFKSVIFGARTVGGWIQTIFSDGFMQLLTFDWNQSDAEINLAIKGTNNSIFESWGEFVGSALASGAVLGVTALIPNVGPIVARMCLPEVTEELKDELADSIRVTLQGTLNNKARSLYMNARSFIKNNEFIQKLAAQIGGNKLTQILQNWGKGGEPWTIYGKIESSIEAIPNEGWRAFAEGVFEGAIEGYLRTVAIVSNKVDDYIQLQNQFEDRSAGPQRSVQIEIDPDSDSPPLVVAGAQRQIGPTIHAVAAMGTLLHNAAVTNPETRADWPRSRVAEGRERYLSLEFRNFEKPPFRRPGQKSHEWSYKIPNPKVGLSFQEIKLAMGGTRGYFNFGYWRAIANLPSGKIVTFASSSAEVDERIEKLLTLTSEGDNWKAWSTAEIKFKVNDAIYRTDIVQAFPYLAILRKRRFVATGGHLDIRSGRRYIDEFETMEVWRDSPRYGTPSTFT